MGENGTYAGTSTFPHTTGTVVDAFIGRNEPGVDTSELDEELRSQFLTPHTTVMYGQKITWTGGTAAALRRKSEYCLLD